MRSRGFEGNLRCDAEFGASSRIPGPGYARLVLTTRLNLPSDGRVLLVVAARNEATALLWGLTPGIEPPAEWEIFPVADDVDLVLSGVGKANAAGATALVLDPGVHGAVLNVGIGGTLERDAPAEQLGVVVGASESVFADEGVAGPDGFRTLAGFGFPPVPAMGDREAGDGVAGDPVLLRALAGLGVIDQTGVVATVSSCSGTDAGAVGVAARTGAIVEAMEGAAVGLTAMRLGTPFAEIRVVSNTTGDRDRQVWDMPGAMAGLERIGAILRG